MALCALVGIGRVRGAAGRRRGRPGASPSGRSTAGSPSARRSRETGRAARGRRPRGRRPSRFPRRPGRGGRCGARPAAASCSAAATIAAASPLASQLPRPRIAVRVLRERDVGRNAVDVGGEHERGRFAEGEQVVAPWRDPLPDGPVPGAARARHPADPWPGPRRRSGSPGRRARGSAQGVGQCVHECKRPAGEARGRAPVGDEAEAPSATYY